MNNHAAMKSKWYLAELLQAFHAADEATELLWVNAILVNAGDAEEAYTKALRFGEALNHKFMNTEGVLITVRFRGLRNLLEIYEEFADGSEIMDEEYEDISTADIEKMATPKDQLSVFLPPAWKKLE
jgi:hypothetical protein